LHFLQPCYLFLSSVHVSFPHCFHPSAVHWLKVREPNFGLKTKFQIMKSIGIAATIIGSQKSFFM